ncbi:MAG: Hsp20/alpha crystallin family protein [Alphaproteobacteria bacterium]
MVEASPHTNADWWPNIVDPLRRFGAKVSEYFTPASDAAATDDAYVVEVELPGVKDEDISVQLHGNMLIVKGNKHSSHEEKNKTYYFSERTYGAFQRTFRLPSDVDESGIKAVAADGVLTLRIPKRKEVETAKRTIQIQRK